jgi:hypothetical protein
MRITLSAGLCAIVLAALPGAGVPAELRDGAHDFDFNVGTWHTHIKRTVKPLSGSPEFIVLDGTVTVRTVWGGRAQLEEIEADGPNGHWEGMTLFLYNPAARQWSQTYAGSKNGVLDPPSIGSFKEGKGEFYSEDTVNERTVLARGTWSDIQPDSHHFRIDYSDDGGRTWEPVFVAELTRLKP